MFRRNEMTFEWDRGGEKGKKMSERYLKANNNAKHHCQWKYFFIVSIQSECVNTVYNLEYLNRSMKSHGRQKLSWKKNGRKPYDAQNLSFFFFSICIQNISSNFSPNFHNSLLLHDSNAIGGRK